MSAVLAAAMTVALTSCGAGGSGSSAAGPPPTTTPTTSPIPTVAPPTTAPNIAVAGRAVDENGNGVANATVSFGTGFTFVPGGTIAGVVATAVTNATGGFAATLAAGSASFVEVDAAGRATAHKMISTAASSTLAAWTLPSPTADEVAGLAALNSDRASAGTGPGAQPLSWDADMLLVARYRAQHMATLGFFDHVAPGASIADADVRWQAISNSLYVPVNPSVFDQENIGYGVLSLVAAEDGYFNHDSDPSQGHRRNILSRGNVWVGVGEAFGGLPYAGAPNQSGNYYAELFITTCANPCP